MVLPMMYGKCKILFDRSTPKGATLSCQTEGLTFRADHDDPTSILQRRMLDAFSDFERALMRKRQTKSGAHD